MLPVEGIYEDVDNDVASVEDEVNGYEYTGCSVCVQ